MRQGCWDNAVAETFFVTLKKELVYRSSWPTRRELTGEICEYIEAFYNPRRRHSTCKTLADNQQQPRPTTTLASQALPCPTKRGKSNSALLMLLSLVARDLLSVPGFGARRPGPAAGRHPAVRWT
jgi:hypothetical protein